MSSKKKITREKIPDVELGLASLKARNPSKDGSILSSAVHLFATHLKMSIMDNDIERQKEDWGAITKLMTEMIECGFAGGMMDLLSNAWEKTEVHVSTVMILDEVVGYKAIPTNKHRQPVTVALVNAISFLQFKLDRVPTRPEIIEFMAKCGDSNCAFDEPELCRQLKKLGWQDLIPRLK
jgi:hypothetical protein